MPISLSVAASSGSRNFVPGLPFFRVEQVKLQGAPGQTWTVEQWLNHQLKNIAAPPVVTENEYSA